MWAPGRIPAGTSTNAFSSTLDLLPTIASLTKSKLPANKIDGKDISATLISDRSPRNDMLFYSARGELQGIREGDWKLLEITKVNRKNKTSQTTSYLFNLADDIGEQNNLFTQYPERAGRLRIQMQRLDAEITKNARSVWRKTE
jgi:arylsulfatase A-like enzyme